MTIVAVASLKGAPGATALACALAGRVSCDGRRTLLVEADPDGGTLAAQLHLRLQPCLTDLAGTARRALAAEAVWEHAHQLTRTLHAVVAHPSPEQTAAAIRAGGANLATALAALDAAVVVDAGRVRPSSPALPLLDTASAVLVVLRPELAQVMNVLHGLDWIGDHFPVGLVVIGTKPYSARQVAEVTGFDVVAALPHDPVAVEADPFATSTKRRNAWAGAVGALARRLGLDTAPEPPPEILSVAAPPAA